MISDVSDLKSANGLFIVKIALLCFTSLTWSTKFFLNITAVMFSCQVSSPRLRLTKTKNQEIHPSKVSVNIHGDGAPGAQGARPGAQQGARSGAQHGARQGARSGAQQGARQGARSGSQQGARQGARSGAQ